MEFIPPDNYFLFVGIARFGQIKLHSRAHLFPWLAHNQRAVALVVGIETNFVVESILEAQTMTDHSILPPLDLRFLISRFTMSPQGVVDLPG